MKIGILTYHACYNYGANLQAYALQQFLSENHYNCEIIDYRNKELLQVNCVLNFHIWNKFDIAFFAYNFVHFFGMIKRKRLFESFIANKLKLSKFCSTGKDVQKICKMYDLIVCGSDQIWNTDPRIKYNASTYFLDFKKEQKRIAYAASFGTNVKFVNEEQKQKIIKYIKDFDRVLVRENSAVNFLNSEGIASKKVLDPTLLLTKEKYEKIMVEPKISRPYMVSLNWNGRRFVSDLAMEISNEIGVPVINPISHPRNIFNKARLKLEIGPSEFLGLLKNAEIIVSSSFHAVVFSILFHKPFIAVFNGKEKKFTKTDDRLVELLADLDLSDHIVRNVADVNMERIMNTNYSIVDESLSKLREHSIELLKEALENA